MLILHVKSHDSEHEETYNLDDSRDLDRLFDDYESIRAMFERFPKEEAIRHAVRYLSNHWLDAYVTRPKAKA